jgi:glucosyl-3-phosphoglycerate synthase
VLGKGDGVWRAQAVLTGELVCLLDGDLQRFTEDYALRLLAPLLEDPAVQFVKSTFRRPFHGLTDESLGEGGRVTQMAGRPLVGVFYPELAAFAQPLSGQIAIRRDLLASLPVSTGYAFDLGLLIDAYRAVGLDAIAQVDIGRSSTATAISATSGRWRSRSTRPSSTGSSPRAGWRRRPRVRC